MGFKVGPELEAKILALSGTAGVSTTLPDSPPAASRKSNKQPTPGRMNRWERRYADEMLTPRKLAGEVSWWAWESIKVRLANRTWYTPDFAVKLVNGELELHEVKGFWRDDARVKAKVVAGMYPWRLMIVQWVGGRWDIQPLGEHDGQGRMG